MSKITKGARFKKMPKKTKEPQAERTRARHLRSQCEELLLTECFIQISEDQKTGLDQKKIRFVIESNSPLFKLNLNQSQAKPKGRAEKDSVSKTGAA
nr:hypothetical protein [Tanacetum cinerariifolium]